MEGKKVNVVADDTDILVLLMYHWKKNISDIYFQLEAKKHQRKCFVFGGYGILLPKLAK